MVEEDNPISEEGNAVPEEVAKALADGGFIAEQMILSLAEGEPYDTLSDAPFLGFIEILERGDVDQETVDMLAIELIEAKQALIVVANVAAAIIRDAEEKGIPLDISGLRPDFDLPDDMGPPTDQAIEPLLNGAPTSGGGTNQAMALHDSNIARIRRSGSFLTVVFDYAYVLRWTRSIDGGTGWNQAAELTFADGIVHGGGDGADSLNWECATLRTGWLLTPENYWGSVIPAPLQVDQGRVVFVAFSLYGECLIVEGTAVSLTLIGEAKYVDDNLLGYPRPRPA